ncbi:MAG: hypothetical protein EKK47_20475 [Burkholderiales bacterium]|jgi:hypothetical protein|nr:MAG: hypothetical protein EKK47_20475 [Burkholderiales bacterium]
MNTNALRWLAGALMLGGGWLPAAMAQVPVPKPDLDPGAVALRCELHMARAPETVQVLYFYLSDARRAVYETDGNPLGNVVQFSRQRIVVTRSSTDGGVRNYVFDRMIGSLTMSSPGQMGGKEGWTLSGECLRVDASRQKF